MPTDIATRAMIIGLKSSGKTSTEVSELTKISVRTMNDIYARAIKRGFDPNLRPLEICDAYLADAPQSGRPKKQTTEARDKILSKVHLIVMDGKKLVLISLTSLAPRVSICLLRRFGES